MVFRRLDLRRLSITARITYGSLIVSLLFGIVAVVGVFFAVSGIVRTSTLRVLVSDAEPYVTAVQNDPSAPLREPTEDQRVAVVDWHHDILLDTFPEVLRSSLHRIATGRSDVSIVETPRADYLVLRKSVPTSSGTWTVITARSRATTELILGRLTVALIGSAAVMVVAFGLLSFLLARFALRPVARMRARATELAAGTSTAMLPVGPAGDELDALAATLNGLILALRGSADRERQMVSDASHEIRTPLAVLQGRLELAEGGAGDADALLADVRGARRDVRRLADLASNLLELSRIEAGQAAGHVAGRAEWHALIEEAEDAIVRAALLAGEDAEVRFDNDAWEYDAPDVRVAVRDFARVADNLLSNAVGAVRATGRPGTILVTLRSDGEHALVAVSDTGTGIPDDFVSVAFDRFTRSEDARATRTGSGLGLAIVVAILEASGGTIDLENRPGRGLTVLVEFPHVT